MLPSGYNLVLVMFAQAFKLLIDLYQCDPHKGDRSQFHSIYACQARSDPRNSLQNLIALSNDPSKHHSGKDGQRIAR